MSFAALGLRTLLLAGLAAGAVVVLLHLLRRAPRSQLVSHLGFWRKALQRAQPKAYGGPRVPWPSLLFSLAIALLLVAQLGKPQLTSRGAGTTVLVLAADRTMGARDARGQRRMEEALREARSLARRAPLGAQLAVLRAGVHSEVLAPLTQHVADVERALQSVEVDDAPARLDEALALARTLVRASGQPGRVVLLGDRADFQRAAADAIPVEFHSVGEPAETLAVTRFDARRDPAALGEYQTRAEVRSYAAHRARARLVLRDRDTVFAQTQLTLEPGDVFTWQARGFSSAQAELVARLEGIAIEGSRDALASDDVAYAVVPPTVATRVLLVTEGDRFLSGALRADPTVALVTARSAELDGLRATLSRFDVVVLDRVSPRPPLEHPAQLLFGAREGGPVRVGQALREPHLTGFAGEHRVLQGLRLEQLQLSEARALLPNEDDRVLVRAGRDVLALAREQAGARLLALGFDTQGTDLARRVVFPLFLHSSLVWLDRRESEYRSWQAPGQPLRAVGAGGTVLGPTGEALDPAVAPWDTGRAGLYRSAERTTAVSAAPSAGSLAVSLESSLPSAPPARRTLPLTVTLALGLLALVVLEGWLLARGSLR